MASQRHYPLPPKLVRALHLDESTGSHAERARHVSRSNSSPSITRSSRSSPHSSVDGTTRDNFRDEVQLEIVSQVSQIMRGKLEEGIERVFDVTLRDEIRTIVQTTAKQLMLKSHSAVPSSGQEPARETEGVWKKLEDAYEDIKKKDKKLIEAKRRIRILTEELEKVRAGKQEYEHSTLPWGWQYQHGQRSRRRTLGHEEAERKQPQVIEVELELTSVKQQLMQVSKAAEEYHVKLQKALQENESLQQYVDSIRKEASSKDKVLPTSIPQTHHTERHEATTKRIQDEVLSLKQQLTISRKEIERFHALLLNRKKRESGKIQGNQEAIAKAYVKLFAELSSDVATEFLPTVGLDKLEARHQPSQIMEMTYKCCKMAVVTQIYTLLDALFRPQSKRDSAETLWAVAGAYRELAQFAGMTMAEVARKEKDKVLKQVQGMLKTQLKSEAVASSNVVDSFMQQAVDICWEMVTSSPPMVLDTRLQYSESLQDPQHPFCHPSLLGSGEYELVYLCPTLLSSFVGELVHKGWVASRQVAQEAARATII